MPRHLPAAFAVVLALSVPVPALAAAPGTNILVSRPSAFGPLATPATNDSRTTLDDAGSARVVSDEDNHRYVAFVSDADGLSSENDDSVANVYVRDRLLGITTLVSRADGPAGAGANGSSYNPSISADGRWVAFESAATNLAQGASGGAEHVYARNLLNGTTLLIDRADGPDGAIANSSSFDPALTVVGGNPRVAYTSAATNLDNGSTNDRLQVYVRMGTDTEMVSRPDGSTTLSGTGNSSNASISTDGTDVAFQSEAENLTADGNARDDVFVRTLAGTATVCASSPPGNGDSRAPSLNGDGNIVAFTSTSSNFVGEDTSSDQDVYVRRLNPSAIELASQSTAGVKGNEASEQPSITDGGGSVVYASAGDNLTSGDTNGVSDVFLRSAVFGGSTTTLLSQPQSGVESNGAAGNPSISRNLTNNTNLIVFTTSADNMGGDDDDDFLQVYGRLSGFVLSPNPARYISRATGTGPFKSGVNASSLRPQLRSSETSSAMSGDGRFTVFLSAEDDLSAADDDRFINVYRRDNLTGETTLVSRADGIAGAAANATSAVSGGGLLASSSAPSGAPGISADGNRVVFASAASNLVAGDSNNLPDVFVRDVAAGATLLASRQPGGAVIPLPSGEPAISGDGNRVAFVTRFAMDGDAGADSDVYLRDLGAGTTLLVSRKGLGGPPGNDDSTTPAVDADGSHVAFATDADDFVATDLNTSSDVFVRDVAAGQTTLASRAAAVAATANDASFAPALSADGNRVAFASIATNLGGGSDVNGANADVFVRDVAAATTTLVSRTNGAGGVSGNGGSERPAIDASGTRIAFETIAPDLVPGDVNGAFDVILRDTAAGTTELVSRATGLGGAQAGRSSGTPSISGDGDCVAFETTADDLVAMPPGTDFGRVVARGLRGDCPFGPVAGPPPPGPPPPPPGPGADTLAPVVSGVSLSPRRFLAGKRVKKRTRTRPAIGARLRFLLSEAATVTVRIDRLLPGRRLAQRCVRPKRAPRGRTCTRAVRRGALKRAGTAGANRIDVTGTLRGRRLAPGRYRLTVKAKDAAGNVSSRVRVKFRVLPRG